MQSGLHARLYLTERQDLSLVRECGTLPLLPTSPSHSLQRPVHHVVPPSTVTEDYLRSFRPYHTAEDLRMSSLPPLGLDPATAAAYYHPSYLAPHPFPHPAFR